MALQFTRDVRVVVEKGTDRWEVPVLDGFSFSQAINSSEITVNESGATSRRARLLFNDSLAPVEWSMSTYSRPSLANSKNTGVEEVLWAMFAGADTYDSSGAVFKNGASALSTNDATSHIFNFSQSNISSMPGGWNIYFIFEPTGGTRQIYKIADAVVNSASMDFDIDGIATISWSGFGARITDEGSTNVASSITTGIGFSGNFIRNRISTVSLERDDLLIGLPGANELTTVAGTVTDSTDDDAIFTVDQDVTSTVVAGLGITGTNIPANTTVVSATYSDPNTTITMSAASTAAVAAPKVFTVNRDVYDIVVTGGSINFENNISYLTPEELGKVNSPLANITGSRSISGNLTCYLDTDLTTSKSGELFADLVSDTNTVRNSFDMAINVGGTTAPCLTFDVPTAHLEVPVINVEDLLTLDIAFHAQPSAGNADNTDEATIIYKGVAT